MADLVLGGLGVASLISLFQTCNTAYDVFVRSARNLGKDYYRISVLLEVERQKLRLWGQYLGISPSQQCRLLRAETLETQQTVVMLLESVKALLDDIGVIMVRYDVQIVEASQDLNLTNMDISLKDTSLQELRDCPAVKLAQIKRQRTEHTVTSSTSRLGKIRWALSDSSKLTKLVHDLRLINEDLWVSLPVNKWLALARGLPSVILPEIHDQAMLNEVESNATGFQTTKLLAACSDLRRAALSSENGSNQSVGENLRLEVHDVNILSSNAPEIPNGRCIASVINRNGNTNYGILEWRYVDRDLNFERKQIIRSRIKSLAVLLNSARSSEFGLMKCIGFFKDPTYDGERYGLLFEHPNPQALTLNVTRLQANPQPVLPRSLKQYISTTTRTPPYLGYRFRMASALANIVLQIHAANWLHKDIASSNIIFLPSISTEVEGGSGESQPCLIGFDFSRPDRHHTESIESPKSVNNGGYWHPALWPDHGQKPRFRKEFDIFALGVVLLEIGNWKLARDQCSGRDLSRAQNWKGFLLKCAKLLGYRCGSIYQGVVENCLNGPFAENYATGDDLDPGLDVLDIKRSFLFDVVYQLAKCNA